jgi:ADP-heptose:LPS heptosyltransferase
LHPTSCHASAQEILNACLEGRPWSDAALRQLLGAALDARARPASAALFGVLAEGLADRFEPRLADNYLEIFSQAVALANPAHTPEQLTARHKRASIVRAFRGEDAGVRRVFVLSRVTLGADVAVTSVMLDAAKRRFPGADIILAGGEKSRHLFAADPRIRWLPVSYGRGGSLRERLSIWPELAGSLSTPGSIVIDPDSRLTQLGLLPVCPEQNYFYFDSLRYGADTRDSLTTLARRWAAEVFETPDAAPYIAPAEAADIGEEPFIAVNLGVGENLSKRPPDPFEEELLRAVAQGGARMVVDLGAGEEEEARVLAAIARSGAPQSRIRTWRGSFAALASIIARASLYVGYDSAGQHAAAVLGTPLVTVFAGFASPRAFDRWRPTGPGPKEVIRVDRPDPPAVLQQTLAAIRRLRA